MARKKPANTLTSAHSKPIKPSTHKPLKGKTIPDTLRVLILGAGFSKAAGFPLGNELFPEIRRAVTNQYGKENHVERDLAHYLEFHKATTGETMAAEQVDFEKLLAFLDNEHFLRLKGKDTWSSDGNESQLMIRHAIGRVLLDKTPTVIPEV